MGSAHELLHRLLDYIGEQAKNVDPRGFRLTGHPSFLPRRESMAGLSGVEFDIKVDASL